MVDVGYIFLCNKFKKHPKRISNAEVKALVKSWWVNASQGVQRMPWSDSGPNHLLTSSQWYSFFLDRCLSGYDYLTFLGWGDLNSFDFGHLDSDQVKAMAGEGVHVACLGLCIQALVVSAKLPGLFQDAR